MVNLGFIKCLLAEKHRKIDERFNSLKISDSPAHKQAIAQAIDDVAKLEKEYTTLIIDELERNYPPEMPNIERQGSIDNVILSRGLNNAEAYSVTGVENL